MGMQAIVPHKYAVSYGDDEDSSKQRCKVESPRDSHGDVSNILPRDEAALNCEEISENYDVYSILAVGSYGAVYKGKERKTQRLVAIKCLRPERDPYIGISADALREATCLMGFSHPNIVELIDTVATLEGFTLIFEYMDADLHQLIRSLNRQGSLLAISKIRMYAAELLRGLHACHMRKIIHRDIKPQNILINENGLKIGDFGLARSLTAPTASYTENVVTLWYRAPEILLGASEYGSAIDVWSAGCVIAEMGIGRAFFPGDSEFGTLLRIFKALGTPTEETWPGVSSLKNFNATYPKWPPTDLQLLLQCRPDLQPATEFLRSLLTMNPLARIRAGAAQYSSFLLPEHGQMQTDDAATEDESNLQTPHLFKFDSTKFYEMAAAASGQI